MSALENIYRKLPIALQNVACSFEGWNIQRTRFNNSSFKQKLTDAEARQNWSENEICAYRDRRLREFIQHCVQTVPYYRKQFQVWRINPTDIYSLDDLSQLPILTREEVKEHSRELLSSAVPPRQRVTVHTSGSTGGGLRLATTRQAIHEQWAIWWRYWRRHGITPDTWCGYFGGRVVVPETQMQPPFWRFNVPGKQILFSIYHMRPDTLPQYVLALNRYQPVWLHGYPSMLAYLATYLVETGKSLEYEMKRITTGAESLLPQQAQMIQKAFGVQPIHHYGMAEGVANISMCEAGNLHVDEDYAAVEFIPNPTGIGYKIIGSNFTNMATPLLRYDVQDVAMLPNDNTICSCGRPGRVVSAIDGRQEDYLVLKNGTYMGRLAYHIFTDMLNVREAQLYQKTPGEIFARIVRGKNYTEADEQKLLRRFHARIGENDKVEIVYVDSLPRTRNGKLRFVVSEIDTAQLEQWSN